MRYCTLLAFTVAFLPLVCVTHRTEAGSIVYVETVTGSGTLNGVAFTNALITLTQTADTGAVITSPAVGGFQSASSTVAIAGLGSGSFTDPTTAEIVRTTGEFAFYQGTPTAGGFTILDQTFPGLVGYNLTTSTGPDTGSGSVFVDPLVSFNTTSGALELTSTSGNVIFAATFTPTAAVPEPSSLAACGIAMVLGLGFRLARRPVT